MNGSSSLGRDEASKTLEVEIAPQLYAAAVRDMHLADSGKVLNEYQVLMDMKREIKHNIKDIVGVTVDVAFVEPGSIERSEGKAQRVIDRRPK